MLGGYGYYFNDYTVLIIIPAIILAFVAQAMVQSAVARYSKVRSIKNILAQDVAKSILDSAGIHDVSIEAVQGQLNDHYDPRSKKIRLSTPVYNSSSIAAIGIAAHEAGHAVQHSKKYAPLVIRNAVIPVTQVASSLAIPLVIIGFVLQFMGLVWLGIFFFAGAVVFQLITLPVEFNASKSALAFLQNEGILYEEELVGAKKVLNAAALTYVAAVLVSLLQLVRLVLLANNRRN